MATITGTDASDFLVGTADADLVNGGLGNDTIRGLGGNDTLNGAEGNDNIDGGDGNDSLIGSAGDDTMQGGMNSDTLDGGAGNDVVRGGKGFDSIVGGDGNDTLYSGLGNDTLTGGSGADVFVVRGSDANFPGALKTPNITDFVAGTDTIAIEGATDADITAALAAQTTVDGGVSFSINGATIVVKGTGLTSLTSTSVVTEANIPDSSSEGQSFTLTTSADNITGTSLNDTINGANGTEDTFTVTDVIDGGTGTDTLSLVLDAGGTALPAGSVSNVEVLQVRDTVGATLDLDLIQSFTSVVLKGGTANTTLDNVDTRHTSITMDSVKGDTVVNSGDVTTLNVTLAAVSGLATADDVDLDITEGGTAITTLNLTSTSASSLAVLNSDEVKTAALSSTGGLTVTDWAEAGALETLTTSGSGAVTLNDLTDAAALKTVTHNGTGTASFDYGTALSTTVTAVTASSSGAIKVTSGANTTAITGGSGDDSVGIGALVYSGTAKLDGGAGTDTLSISDATATVFTTAAKANISNFEILDVTGANGDAIDFEALTGLTALTLGANTNVTVSNLGASTPVTISATQTTDLELGVKSATTPGQDDTLSVKIDTSAAAVTVDKLGSEGTEFLKLEVVDDASNDLTTITAFETGTDFESITITGAGDITFTSTAAATALDKIDASALTGTFTIDASGATNGIAINGSSTATNTITGTAQGDSITGGSAADSLLGGAGDDTISSGDGNDYISSGAGADAITTGAGSDLVEMTTNASVLTFATVSDFAAGDALSFANKGTETFTSAAVSLGGGSTLTDYMNAAAAGNGGTNGIVRWFQFEGNTYVVQDLSAGATFTANTDRAIKLTGLIDLSTATLSTANNTLTNGSSATGTTALIVNQTLTGTAGADNLSGGEGNDTITGSTGADQMSGGGGADVFVQSGGDSVARTAETITVGNMGNGETITFAGGVDVISDFVSGTDKLDVTTAGSFTAFGAGSDASNLTGNNNYSIRGDFTSGTGVFTTNFAGGADLLVVTNAANADLDAAGQNSIIILTGITSLAAGDFI